MRTRGFRVLAIIAVIIGLSIATLSFKEIHISFLGADLDRTGSGPLGLTLGLDLQGGSHLVYQANIPVEVTFQDSIDESQLLGLVKELGYKDADIQTPAASDYSIRRLSFGEVAQAQLREDLEEVLGPINVFDAAGSGLVVAFQDSQEDGRFRDRLSELGYVDAIVTDQGRARFMVENLSFEEVAQLDLRSSLEDRLSLVQSFATGDEGAEVTFLVSQDRTDVRELLDELGYTAAILSQRYEILGLALKAEAQLELELALEGLAPVEVFNPGEAITEDKMKGVEDTIQRRVNALGTSEPIIQTLGDDRLVVQLPGVGGSSVSVTFLSPPGPADITRVLEVLGRTGDTVVATSLNTFDIGAVEALSEEEKQAIREALVGGLGPLEEFETVTGDDATLTVTFPLPPDENSISAVVASLGLTDFSVQGQSAPNQFVVRTEEAMSTEDQEMLREALEEKVALVFAFSTRGGIEEAKALIRGTAQLVFMERNCLLTLAALEAASAVGAPDPCGIEGNYIDKDIGLTGEFLDRAFPGQDPISGAPWVHVEFNSRGAGIFRDLTERLFDMGPIGRIAMFLDDDLISAPSVTSPIRDGRGVITGGFTRESAKDLAIQLDSGRLPVPLKLIRESTVDALLGSDSLRKSLIAGLVGLSLVLGFMIVYYRMAGVVAAVSLLIYATIVLAILKLLPGNTLTLSGIAGLVLSIGFAVDANILIFERMKEELRTGRSLTSAMEVGFRRAWVAIRDSNFSTILTCGILFLFGSRLGGGTPVVTGFALTLLIGVSVSMFTAIMVSRNLLQIVALTPAGRNMALFTPEPRRQPVAVAGGGK